MLAAAGLLAQFTPAAALAAPSWITIGDQAYQVLCKVAPQSQRLTEAQVRGTRKSAKKTNAARTVRLNGVALAALKRQAALTAETRDEVFQDPRYDLPWDDERALRRSFWTPTLKDLGTRYRRPYNMRHTYATVILMAGMNHLYCAKQLERPVEMLLRTYSKWIDGAQNDREVQLLETAHSSPALPQETESDT